MSSIARFAHTGCEAARGLGPPMRRTMPRAMFTGRRRHPLVRPPAARRAGHVGCRRGVAQRDAAAVSRVDHEVATSSPRARRRRRSPGIETSRSVDAHNPSIWSAKASTKSSKSATVRCPPRPRGSRCSKPPWQGWIAVATFRMPSELAGLATVRATNVLESGLSTPGAVHDARDDRRSAVQATPDLNDHALAQQILSGKEIWSANGLWMSATPARRIAERLAERCVRSRFGLVDAAVPEEAQF